MVNEIEIYFERNFKCYPSSTRVSEANQHHIPFIIVVDDSGNILTLLSAAILQLWSRNETIEAMRDYWPTLYTLPESEATDIDDVARFFRDDLIEQPDVPGIVLVDHTGQPAAILSREILLYQETRDTTAVSKDILESYVEPGGQEAKILADRQQENELKVQRYARLQFPAQVSLKQPCTLTITIHRQEVPGVSNQFKLELTRRKWPIKLIASLRNIQESDFLILGPSYGIIEVPYNRDSAPLTFTLIPQSTGKKSIKILFEQIGEARNNYVARTIIQTEVVAHKVESSDEAEVLYAPTVTCLGDPPDVTIYVDKVTDLKYHVSVRTFEDKPESEPRFVDEITFTSSPQTYIQAYFNDLDIKTSRGLSPGEFDEAVKLIGNRLFNDLFLEAGFKAFYWNSLSKMPEGSSVQIVSEEPYIPWEILLPFQSTSDGRNESDALYFCQRFAISRWWAGPDFGSKLPVLKVILVAPPSDLRWVEKEVEAIRNMPGLDVKLIKDKQSLLEFFKTGEADIVHFACHGAFDATNPARSRVLLGSQFLRSDEVVAENSNFGRFKPLVFLNACDSGQRGIGLTGMDGWAKAFTEDAKVGFFIGSLWKTTDELAYRFATVFYELLKDGYRVGEAMRQARQAIRVQGDATFLSYTFYGNPRIRARSM